MSRRFRDEDDDDFDDEDEDDRPRRRRGQSSGGGMAVWMFVALGLGTVAVFGLIAVLVASGKKRDDTAAETPQQSSQPATQPQPQPRPRSDLPRVSPPDTAPKGNSSTNWAKAIGTWQREVPASDPNSGYPYQLEFRKDLTATATWNRQDGPAPQDMRVEVRDDRGDSLLLVLHVPMGTYSYSFKVKPDGTLVLDDTKDGLVFQRVK